MDTPTKEDVVAALGNLTVLQIIALTKQLEEQWGVKAEPQVVEQQKLPEQIVAKTEFNVWLMPVSADKKMPVIKAVRDLFGIGLKESKDMVEAAPKMVKEAISPEEAETLKTRLTEAGAVVELR
jgi:large subunit ribosomal protein L7/L12